MSCKNSGRTVQYKLHAQYLRLFDVHSDVNDAHRASANRLQNKTKNLMTWIYTLRTSAEILAFSTRTTLFTERDAVRKFCVENDCICFCEPIKG